MKKTKTLFINYIVLTLLSTISLISFKQKGNDFFIALSSLSADLSLVYSIIVIVYSLLFCISLSKEKKYINKNILKSLLILTLTMITVYITFVNIYAHRNIIEYIIRVINGKENLDIIVLFIESLFVYIFIYLCSLVGLLLNKYYKKIGTIPIILITLILLIIMFLVYIEVKLLLFIWIIDIVLYIVALILIKKDSLLK